MNLKLRTPFHSINLCQIRKCTGLNPLGLSHFSRIFTNEALNIRLLRRLNRPLLKLTVVLYHYLD